MASNDFNQIACSLANPLVAIVQQPKAAHLPFGLGMGFISERFKGNKRLITTCRHNFNVSSQNYKFIFATAVLGTNETDRWRELTMIGQPIFDPREGSDIAFAIVKDPENARTRVLKAENRELPIPTNPPELSNVRNASFDNGNGTYQFEILTQLDIAELDRQMYQFTDNSIVCEPVKNEQHASELVETGYFPCRTLTMISRPGCSGSPILNDNFELFGMDIGGTEAGDKDGDIAICIPSNELYEARRLIDAEIQATLSP